MSRRKISLFAPLSSKAFVSGKEYNGKNSFVKSFFQKGGKDKYGIPLVRIKIMALN